VTERLILDADELDSLVAPYLSRIGHEIPTRGSYIAAVALDERGEIVGHQLLQNALFMEGMGASDARVPLRKLHNMLADHAQQQFGATRLMTLTRSDEQGERIGRCAKRLGYEQMPWKIYRRTL
jgi:hypothetical protein